MKANVFLRKKGLNWNFRLKGSEFNGNLLDLLNDYKEALTEQSPIQGAVEQSEHLLAFKKWEAEKCKLPWDASPEQIIEEYLSQ